MIPAYLYLLSWRKVTLRLLAVLIIWSLYAFTLLVSRDEFEHNNGKYCQKQHNIMFLKMHKCASSSIQNILMRFGDKQNLTFVLPRAGNYLSKYRFQSKFSNRLTLPLPSAMGDEYNIFCHHAIWNRKTVLGIMPVDTVYISILRDPASMFESFYTSDQLEHSELDYISLETFLDNPMTFYNKIQQRQFMRNPMMMNFGLSADDSDKPRKVAEKIAEISSTFSLIMFTEYMDESLVLLRHHLCWDWGDVIVFQTNSRKTQYKQSISPEMERKIHQWNAADSQLYYHFRQRFQTQMEDYGLARLESDVRYLRQQRDDWYRRCVGQNISTEHAGGDKRFEPWHFSISAIQPLASALQDPVCVGLTTNELAYTDILRDKLWPPLLLSTEPRPL